MRARPQHTHACPLGTRTLRGRRGRDDQERPREMDNRTVSRRNDGNEGKAGEAGLTWGVLEGSLTMCPMAQIMGTDAPRSKVVGLGQA